MRLNESVNSQHSDLHIFQFRKNVNQQDHASRDNKDKIEFFKDCNSIDHCLIYWKNLAIYIENERILNFYYEIIMLRIERSPISIITYKNVFKSELNSYLIIGIVKDEIIFNPSFCKLEKFFVPNHSFIMILQSLASFITSKTLKKNGRLNNYMKREKIHMTAITFNKLDKP
ncbi:hypothetical protein BpHYR1_041123 [Brachionus plicatilis]|uniref:Uncharacterized protein n=1 Tax=Brachionus plicatilis TaxID=10195 RepID=A0A3M7S3N6_BRAPC|nr:hypothetical protein BpHYR1_041123 [Brachionus plicatilis]